MGTAAQDARSAETPIPSLRPSVGSAIGAFETAVRIYVMLHWDDPAGLRTDPQARELLRKYTSHLRRTGLEPEAVLIRIKRLLNALRPEHQAASSAKGRAFARSSEVIVLICIEEYFDYRRSRP